jgi:20S proteasome subunit beta 3
MSYNGGAVVAMKGKNCVAIAADKRFGIQAQTLALDFQVRLHDRMSQG